MFSFNVPQSPFVPKTLINSDQNGFLSLIDTLNVNATMQL